MIDYPSNVKALREMLNPNGGKFELLVERFQDAPRESDADNATRAAMIREMRDFLNRCAEDHPTCACAEIIDATAAADNFIPGGGWVSPYQIYTSMRKAARQLFIDLAGELSKTAKPTRADAGKPHRKHKKIKDAWRSAADVADDFNKSAFMPKDGKRKLGTCDEKKINGWDAKYPDAEHKNKWGYYARLRVDANLKSKYYEVLQSWARHWTDYKEWDKRHPGVKFKPMRRTDIDPARIGRTETGLMIEPRDDPRRT